jgi:hypothetical protein
MNDAASLPDITLQQSGFLDNSQAWTCAFKNNMATPVTVKATAVCLMPAS